MFRIKKLTREADLLSARFYKLAEGDRDRVSDGIMTFLNATLIFGAGAVAVPIVLHLIARREPRKVVFPSVRFLTKRFDSNRSRLQVRRWWLLALRIAALVALALALARPAASRRAQM